MHYNISVTISVITSILTFSAIVVFLIVYNHLSTINYSNILNFLGLFNRPFSYFPTPHSIINVGYARLVLIWLHPFFLDVLLPNLFVMPAILACKLTTFPINWDDIVVKRLNKAFK